MQKPNIKIAIIHDYLNQAGGAEKVLKIFIEIFPKAPIYTLFYDKSIKGLEFLKAREIRTSFLQKLPFIKKYHRVFPALMPIAIESLDLSEFDIVFSSSWSFGKGVITGPNTYHICYCYTPTRFLWEGSQEYIKQSNFLKPIKYAIPFLATYLRIWDRQASNRVDKFIAISNCVSKRIKKYYNRKSEIIPPPISIQKEKNEIQKEKNKQKYFIIVSRLVPYKKIDLAIDAFNELKLPLKIIGIGPLEKKLKKQAGLNIEFLGRLSEQELNKYYSEARALIFPQEEDFGLVATEAISLGTPVIAYRAGGAEDIIQEGVNGIFFNKQNKNSLIEAVKKFQKLNLQKWNKEKIKKTVSHLDEKIFKQKIEKIIKSYENWNRC
ncbi:MAG: glycosyltransferase [Patescibacteria group bacterium]